MSNIETHLGQAVVAIDFHKGGCGACAFSTLDCSSANCTPARRLDGRNVYFVPAPSEALPPIPDCPPAPVGDGTLPPDVGRKNDKGKLDLGLLFDDCPHAMEAIAEVLVWAVTHKKPVPYVRGSWYGLDDFFARYRSANYRHQLNAAKAALVGGTGRPELAVDPETGLPELAHQAACIVFQLERLLREKAKETT